MIITDNHLNVAYRKLKMLVYYDKTDLSLRYRLSEFECNPSFQKKLETLKDVLNSGNPLEERHFKRWLRKINFRVVPKSYGDNDLSAEDIVRDGTYISNVTSAKTYQISRVNYFFDGPIELHLIAVLWIMFEGQILDSQLGKECYGARLEDSLSSPNDQSAALYRKYHELYARWRDSGISKAKQLLTEEKESVCILGLDVQEYYYHIQLDFAEIARLVSKPTVGRRRKRRSPSNLLKCLESICVTYRKNISPLFELTHEHIPSSTLGIPIGLCSSALLANWCLRDFDKAVKNIIRPAYYGRYVDDILLVIQYSDDTLEEESPVTSFMDSVLVERGVIHELEDGRYELSEPGNLFLQQDKCILQYFDSNHSIAGLEKFQKKLEESGSEFLLMPVDEADNSLEDVAYELLYEGSVNKFRSVKGMAENRFELAKHLARQTILHLLTDDPLDIKISVGLEKFFKGANAIKFYDLWERVFTLFIISNDSKSAKIFAKNVKAEIKRVRYMGELSITKHLRDNLMRHLSLCIAMSIELGDSELQLSEDGQKAQESFRDANLIRHHFVRTPLLNYTTYSGPLNTRTFEDKVKSDSKKVELSPRYVNFDECLLLANSGAVKFRKQSAFQWACSIYKDINGHGVQGVEWKTVSIKEDSYA